VVQQALDAIMAERNSTIVVIAHRYIVRCLLYDSLRSLSGFVSQVFFTVKELETACITLDCCERLSLGKP
jgi:hypothetical protein